jgi:nucleoid-associated protein EbfC
VGLAEVVGDGVVVVVGAGDVAGGAEVVGVGVAGVEATGGGGGGGAGVLVQAASVSTAARTRPGTARTERSGASTRGSVPRLGWLAADPRGGGRDDARRPLVQPGQPDLQMIMQQAQKMQEQLIAAQAELASSEVTGQAGNGLVQVTMTAAGDVRGVRIDPQVVDPDDVDTLQDLVVGALHDAARAAQQLQAEKMGPLAGGLGDAGGLGLPGL